MTPLLFLDTETTGLRPDIHVPWEIAWTTAVHDAMDGKLHIAERFTGVIDLTRDQHRLADPAALKIGRFEERYTEFSSRYSWGAVNLLLRAACKAVAGRTAQSVPHLVGAVPSFDHAMLCVNHLGWPGFGAGLWHYHLIDVEVLAAGAKRWPPPYSSDALTESYGVTVDEAQRHTAAGDVSWALRLYAAVYSLRIVEPAP